MRIGFLHASEVASSPRCQNTPMYGPESVAQAPRGGGQSLAHVVFRNRCVRPSALATVQAFGGETADAGSSARARPAAGSSAIVPSEIARTIAARPRRLSTGNRLARPTTSWGEGFRIKGG